MEKNVKFSFDRLFRPNTIAVIGANEKSSYAGRTLRNLMGNKYTGKIYPVNPTHSEVFSMKCYPSISAIDDTVDLAIIVVKASMVVDTVKECIQCGVGGILIITAGFKEVDPIGGAQREAELRNLAEENGVPIIGPNCNGFASIYNDMWACGISELPANPLPKGHSAIISQSGAAGFGPLLSIARDRRVGMKYIISTGNEAVLNICDYLDCFLDDPDIRSVSMLIEGFKDARRFIDLAKKAQQMRKTLIVLKSGESEVGQRAAKSHTASMTGDMALFNAITKQYGVIKAEDYDELVELARMTQKTNALRSRRIAAVSHSGGISGFTGDQMGKHGFEVPVFSEETRAHIDSYLKGFGSPNNPLDLTGQMRSGNLPDILLTAEEKEDIGAFVISSHGSGARFDNIISAIEQVHLPVYFNWTGSMYSTDGINRLLDMDIPISYSIQKMSQMLDKMVTAFEICDNAVQEENAECEISLPENDGMLSEPDAKKLLNAAGISTPKRWLIGDKAELPGVWAQIPEGRSGVLKIVSDSILHKTDIGGVKLNIKSLNELETAYDALDRLKGSRHDISGIMLEEMCGDGLDMVIGIRRDEQFGPVIMIGLGGIYTELFKLVSIRSLPLSSSDIGRALDEIPGFSKLLAGYRGHCGYDRAALVKTIRRLSDIVMASDERISLLEINPLRVMDNGQGVCALDCVLELKSE